MTTVSIDGLMFRLAREWDTSGLEDFLRRWGRVTKIWDDQDSGNLCFGLTDGAGRYFVKFAGAPTARYTGELRDAVMRLREALPVYEHLRHPSLIHLVETAEVGDGLAAVFDWVDGICMGRQYPDDHCAFMALPLEHKHRVYRDILDFHRHVVQQGWMPVDFYDGSVLYDPRTGKTTICDIDFYRRGTFVNDMGRMWGSSRFMSPEEKTLGAVIDERTVVYLMGATAFALFTDSDRSREAWTLGDESYRVLCRAVQDEKKDRYQTVEDLIKAWESA